MSERVLTRGHIHRIQWEYGKHREQLNLNRESVESVLMDDGSLVCRTIHRPGHGAIPRIFLAHQKRWRGFLTFFPTRELQLNYKRTHVHTLGPPPRHEQQPPEWTIYLSYLSQGLGERNFEFTWQGTRPPIGTVMNDLRLLAQRSEPLTQPLQAPILVRGDLLLGFLGAALPALVTRTYQSGKWLAEKETVTPIAVARPITHDFGESDGETLDLEPLVPTRWRFIPNHFERVPTGAWRALDYEKDLHFLICADPHGHLHQVKIHQPIYHYFKSLHFVASAHHHIVRGIRYDLPTAILPPGTKTA